MISALPIWMFMQYVAANDAAFIVIPTSFIDLTACIQIGGLTFENKAHFIQIEGWTYIF